MHTEILTAIRKEDTEFEYNRTLMSRHHNAIKITPLHGRRLIGYGSQSELGNAERFIDESQPLAALDVPHFYTPDGKQGIRLATVGDGINYIKALMSTVMFYNPENTADEVFMREAAAELVTEAIHVFYDELIFVNRTFPRPTSVYEIEMGRLDHPTATRASLLPHTADREMSYLDTEVLSTLALYDISASDIRYGFRFHVPMIRPEAKKVSPVGRILTGSIPIVPKEGDPNQQFSWLKPDSEAVKRAVDKVKKARKQKPPKSS